MSFIQENAIDMHCVGRVSQHSRRQSRENMFYLSKTWVFFHCMNFGPLFVISWVFYS